MDKEEVRQEALRRVFREHPEWIGTSDSATLAQIQHLAETYQAEISLSQEVEELRRQQFAEEARLQGQQARVAREEQARRDAQEAQERRQEAEALAAEELERQRQEKLARMTPARRWMSMHPGVIWAGVVCVGLALVAASLLGIRASSTSNERAKYYGCAIIAEGVVDCSGVTDDDISESERAALTNVRSGVPELQGVPDTRIVEALREFCNFQVTRPNLDRFALGTFATSTLRKWGMDNKTSNLNNPFGEMLATGATEMCLSTRDWVSKKLNIG